MLENTYICAEPGTSHICKVKHTQNIFLQLLTRYSLCQVLYTMKTWELLEYTAFRQDTQIKYTAFHLKYQEQREFLKDVIDAIQIIL